MVVRGAPAAAMAMAEDLGAAITGRGWAVLTRGRPEGVMAAACRGASRVEGHLVVGVLPGYGRGHQRQHTSELDPGLFTGMGQARNLINVLSADVVVDAAGLSEATQAVMPCWRAARTRAGG